jgi:hypothetical protein
VLGEGGGGGGQGVGLPEPPDEGGSGSGSDQGDALPLVLLGGGGGGLPVEELGGGGGDGVPSVPRVPIETNPTIRCAAIERGSSSHPVAERGEGARRGRETEDVEGELNNGHVGR